MGDRLGSGIREVAQQPEALEALVVFAGLDGQELQPSSLLAGCGEGGCRGPGLIGGKIAQQPAVFQACFQHQLLAADLEPHRLEPSQPARQGQGAGGAEQTNAWHRHLGGQARR